MKIILFLLLSIPAFSCDCATPGPTEGFQYFDLVAKVQMVKKKTHRNDSASTYPMTVQVLELFKGTPLNEIDIWGNNGRKFRTSCDMDIEEGSVWIIFASKNEEGNYFVEPCSGSRAAEPSENWGNDRAATKYRTSVAIELEVLRTLAKVSIASHYTATVHEAGMLYDSLKAFRGLPIDQDYGLYKLILNEKQDVEKVEVISGFTKELDDQLVTLLKTRSSWKVVERYGEKWTPQKIEWIIGMYRYKEEENNPSFLSINFL